MTDKTLATYQGQQEIAEAIRGINLDSITQKAVWVDSVADMRELDAPQGITVATRGYYEPNDGGNGFYYIRAKEVGAVDDGGSVIFLNNDNEAKLITDGTVCPEQFGAYGDGTHSDGEAIQNCMNASVGKVIVGSKIYNMDCTPQNGYLCNIPDGTHVVGGTFKFPNGGQDIGGYTLGCNLFTGNSFVFENVTIDMNGYNNIVTTPTKTMYALRVADCDGVTLRNCRFKDSAGRNYIVVNSGSKFVMKNCSFKNGGTNIDGNTSATQNDFSYVYVSADNCLIDGCIIETPDKTPFTYCGGIEVHGSNFTVTNNVINSCLPAMYIARYNSGTTTIKNVTISNNLFQNCNAGLGVFDNTNIENVTISNNRIVIARSVTLSAHFYGISAGTGTTAKNVIVENNVIIGYQTGGYLTTAIRFRDFSGLSVVGNTILDCRQPISITSTDGVVSSNGKICNNIVKIAEEETSYFAITCSINGTGSYTNLLVKDNDILNYPAILNSTTGITLSEIYCKATEIRSAHYSTGLFFASESVTSGAWKMLLKGKRVEFWKDETIGTSGITLTYPFLLSTVEDINVVAYGTSTTHTEQVSNLGTANAVVKSTVDSLACKVSIVGWL